MSYQSAPPHVSPSSRLDATLRRPLSSHDYDNDEKQQRMAATATRQRTPPAFANTTRLSSTSAPRHLLASFKIGSCHGRVDFASTEKVFHRHDVPAAAQNAKSQTMQWLRGGGWNPSTSLSNRTASERFDDRHYAAEETAARVDRAQRRIATIRAGNDPDLDKNNINPRWDVGTSEGPERKLKANAILLNAELNRLRHDSDAPTLVQREGQFMQVERTRKAQYRDMMQAEQAKRDEADKWWRLMHVNGGALEPGVGRRIQPADQDHEWQNKLHDYLSAQQQHEHKEQDVSQQHTTQQSSSISSSASASASASTSASVSPSSPLKSSVSPSRALLPPAWARRVARSNQIRQAKQPAPFPAYVHTAQFAERDGEYSWQCCGGRRDARGCVAVPTESDKERIVLARSDDAACAAGRGWLSRISHTNSFMSLDASDDQQLTVAGLPAHSVVVGPSGPGVAVVVRWFHSGRYEQEKGMWSCCCKADEKSRGCEKKTVTKEHRWAVQSE